VSRVRLFALGTLRIHASLKMSRSASLIYKERVSKDTQRQGAAAMMNVCIGVVGKGKFRRQRS
jgi:hypothetical protein